MYVVPDVQTDEGVPSAGKMRESATLTQSQVRGQILDDIQGDAP